MVIRNMRYEAIMAQSGAFFQRSSAIVIPALVAGAFAVAAPPAAVFGSANLEHAKDAFACVLAALGLARRLQLACTGRGAAAERASANLTIIAGAVLMHGQVNVLAVGMALLVVLSQLMRHAQSDEMQRESDGGGSQRRGFIQPSPRVVARELIVIAATAATLAFVEFYEYLPNPSAHEMQLYLLIGSGILLACIVPSYIGDLLSTGGNGGDGSPEGRPTTRGIRVDRRVGSVDVLENMLSFGNLEPILLATLAAADLKPDDRLVDVGCGTGKLAIVASRGLDLHAGGSALGIDATPGMIHVARQRAIEAESAAQFEVGVGEALPLPDGSADAVTSSYFLHHLPSDVKREALHDMWRVLAPGGRLVITDYARPRSLLGWIASIPMRFNFYEFVRPQLGGELDRLLAEADFGPVEVTRVFLGYITVFRIRKLDAAAAVIPRASSLSASAVPAA